VSEDSGTAGRLFRRFMLGSGPLKRGSDRVQVAARVLLLALVLTAVPVALAVATVTGSQMQSLADAQAAVRHQVEATLREDAPPAHGSGHAGAEAAVPASWTAPSGVERNGVVEVRTRAKAGTTVTIWVDRAGDVTTRPLDDLDVVSRAVGHGAATFLGISAMATVGYLAVRRLLDRNRMRRWAADWAVVEPVWSRKVPWATASHVSEAGSGRGAPWRLMHDVGGRSWAHCCVRRCRSA
jgi:hypothetical protein